MSFDRINLSAAVVTLKILTKVISQYSMHHMTRQCWEVGAAEQCLSFHDLFVSISEFLQSVTNYPL